MALNVLLTGLSLHDALLSSSTSHASWPPCNWLALQPYGHMSPLQVVVVSFVGEDGLVYASVVTPAGSNVVWGPWCLIGEALSMMPLVPPMSLVLSERPLCWHSLHHNVMPCTTYLSFRTTEHAVVEIPEHPPTTPACYDLHGTGCLQGHVLGNITMVAGKK